ncbi:MAG: SUMF1/EgtB/PvdO family nonheme iron enzyme [Fibrobacter sp.]|nr:SUMF1/EgtB/PvdO family nonheme iron enzyme [Fibrobacter sp.]
MTKKLFVFMSAVFFLYSSVTAEVISLSGTVLDESGNPIEGAAVKLQSNENIQTTTDSDGQFNLINESSVLKTHPQSLRSSAVFKGAFVDITLAKPSDIRTTIYTISGKKILDFNSGKLDAGSNRINLPVDRLGSGVYLVAVSYESNRNVFRYVSADQRKSNLPAHSKINDGASFGFQKKAATSQADLIDTLVVTANGYINEHYPLSSYSLQGIEITLKRATVESGDFTETVNGVSFDMIYVPGGTFTLGCESGPCPADAEPVSGVKVSSYHIGKNEVTVELWNAVMDDNESSWGSTSMTNITWYDAMEFACKLSRITGRKYRMTTEAEWEYAAKNHLNSLEDIGSNEEWAYNSWNSTHMGGTDPVGPNSGEHTQKTRRDAQGEVVDNITGRLIRSIDGIGPALRLAISAEMDFPPDYVPPCDLHAPHMGDEPVNSYRDPRWITGSDTHWTTGPIAIGSFDLRVWDDGTATLNGTNGQWFTSNNIVFVFVPGSGSFVTYPYIFLDETQGSLLSDQRLSFGFGGGYGYIGRIVKESADNYDKPAISDLKSGAELAAAAGDTYRMIDMVNIPESAKEQDSRLLDGTNQGWFQNNSQNGGVHHYRKDIDPDEFRFTVNQDGNRTMLANGEWFTVNNMFLRVTHSSGYTTDYLYAIDSDGTFYHLSFQAYERADFRIFKLTSNGSEFESVCGSICSGEIPKGEPASIYARLENGHSTFIPAPCPSGGCE